MTKFDKFLEVIFRTKKGLLTIMLTIVASVMFFSGCMALDFLACMCESCECDSCADCWLDCSEDMWDSCFHSCFGKNAVSDCLFADGCEANCGDCLLSCGGANITFFRSCDNCGSTENGCQMFNCEVDCSGTHSQKGGGHSVTYNVVVYYPVKDDYTFDGQYTSKSYSFSRLKSDTGPMEVNTTFYGYNSYYGYSFMQSYFDTYYAELEGFYTDYQLTDKFAYPDGYFVPGKEITSDMVLFARILPKYQNVPVNVKLEFSKSMIVDDATLLNDSYTTIEVGQIPFALQSHPQFEGYTFKNWKIVSDDEKSNDKVIKTDKVFQLSDYAIKVNNNNGTIEANVVLFAVYEKKTMHLFVNNKGDVSEYGIFYGGGIKSSINKTEIKTDGVQFMGWSFDQYGETYLTEEQIENYSLRKDNVTLYAIYKDIVHVNLHNYNGPDSDYITREYLEGTNQILPTPDGDYGIVKFAGWYENSELTSKVDNNTIYVSETKTDYYAKWVNKTQYDINYYTQGITQPIHTATYEYNATGTTALFDGSTIDAPTGYVFAGWCENSDLTGACWTEIPAGTARDLVLYSKFVPKTYAYTLDPIAGTLSVSETGTITYDSIFILPIPDRLGYDFLGWYESNTNIQITYGNGQICKDKFNSTYFNLDFDVDYFDFEAKYTKSEFTIAFTYVDENDETKTVLSYKKYYGETIGDAINYQSTPTKTGYNFVKWIDQNNQELDTSTVVIKNYTFTAVFEIKTFTITFDTTGGTIYGQDTYSTTIEYGSRIQLPPRANMEKEGFIFDGWYDIDGNKWSNYNGQMLDDYTLESGITLYARWKEVD